MDSPEKWLWESAAIFSEPARSCKFLRLPLSGHIQCDLACTAHGNEITTEVRVAVHLESLAGRRTSMSCPVCLHCKP